MTGWKAVAVVVPDYEAESLAKLVQAMLVLNGLGHFQAEVVEVPSQTAAAS